MGGALELGGRGLVELPTGAAEVDVPNGSPPKKSPPPLPVPAEAELEDCGWVWSNEGHTCMYVHVMYYTTVIEHMHVHIYIKSYNVHVHVTCCTLYMHMHNIATVA